jgi:hypothetical protein
MKTRAEPSPEWREFERLVSRIEADAGPAGIKVKSPDRIKCKLTGRLREVDASVRATVGTANVLITIECRKRRHRQDVTWIEQLATKKQLIGAARTIAVSATGFSEDAKVVARQVGIDLRHLSDISVADLNALVRSDFVLFHHKKCSITGVGLRFFREKSWTVPDKADIDLNLTPDSDISRRIFCNIETGDRWSLTDLWLQLQETVDPFEGVERDGKPVIRTVCFPYPGNVEIETPAGTKRLGDVLFSVALSATVEPVGIDSAIKIEYSADNAQALHRVEFTSRECVSGDFSMSLQLPKDAQDTSELRTRLIAPGHPVPKSRP